MILQALLLVTKQAEPIKGLFIRLFGVVLSSTLQFPLSNDYVILDTLSIIRKRHGKKTYICRISSCSFGQFWLGKTLFLDK